MARFFSLAELRRRARRPAENLAVALDYTMERWGTKKDGLPVGWYQRGNLIYPDVGPRNRLERAPWVVQQLHSDFSDLPEWEGKPLFTAAEWSDLKGFDLTAAEALEIRDVSYSDALVRFQKQFGPTHPRRAEYLNARRAWVRYYQDEPYMDWFDKKLQQAAVRRVQAEMAKRNSRARRNGGQPWFTRTPTRNQEAIAAKRMRAFWQARFREFGHVLLPGSFFPGHYLKAHAGSQGRWYSAYVKDPEAGEWKQVQMVVDDRRNGKRDPWMTLENTRVKFGVEFFHAAFRFPGKHQVEISHLYQHAPAKVQIEVDRRLSEGL